MGFRRELEEIERLVFGSRIARMEESHPSVIDESELLLDGSWGDEWNAAASVAYVASLIEKLDAETGDAEVTNFLLSTLLEAAYKWSPDIQPDETYAVGDETGDEDAPPNYIFKRGQRITAAGLTPAMEKGIWLLVKQAADNPPPFVANAKVEDSVKIWKEAAGMAINRGIGWKVETDKKTGMQYPTPDYEAIVTIWKNMVDKATGFRPSASAEKTLAQDIDQHRAQAAKELSKGVEKIGKEAAKRASTIMRGARGKAQKEQE